MSDGPGDGQEPDVSGDADSRHQMLVYREQQELLDAVTSFLRDGLASGAGVMVAAPARRLSWIESALGAQADAVELHDAVDFYRKPGSATKTVIDWLRGLATSGRPAWVVNEQALGSQTAPQVADFLRAEAASNVVFRPFPVSMLCPYNADELTPEVLHEAQRAHPQLRQDGKLSASELFADPADFVRQSSHVVSPPAGADCLDIGSMQDLAGARRFLRDRARAAGLSRTDTDFLLMAAGELITNALVHGQVPRNMWVYTDGDKLVCQVHDSGPGPADPLVAYLVPEQRAPHGQGFWLARQLSDSLDLATDDTGTHARLSVKLPAAPAS
jgi:anti-sigma regulatory factor (Ser/Thr protein kinase)